MDFELLFFIKFSSQFLATRQTGPVPPSFSRFRHPHLPHFSRFDFQKYFQFFQPNCVKLFTLTLIHTTFFPATKILNQNRSFDVSLVARLSAPVPRSFSRFRHPHLPHFYLFHQRFFRDTFFECQIFIDTFTINFASTIFQSSIFCAQKTVSVIQPSVEIRFCLDLWIDRLVKGFKHQTWLSPRISHVKFRDFCCGG